MALTRQPTLWRAGVDLVGIADLKTFLRATDQGIRSAFIEEFGDLDILTASESGISRFRMLVQPVRFKRAMLDAKHEYERDIEGSGYAASPPLRSEPVLVGQPVTDDTVSTPVPPTQSPPAPAAAPLSRDEVTRTLNSLADLRDRGAISADEFERLIAERYPKNDYGRYLRSVLRAHVARIPA